MLANTANPAGSLPDYLHLCAPLLGDKCSAITLYEIGQGITAVGRLVCPRIATASPILSRAKRPAQRVIRFATAESTCRSKLDAASLVDRFAERALQLLDQLATEVDLWLIIDCSELRKSYRRAMPDLMKGRALDGDRVPGYRTINVIAVAPVLRVLLFHHLFSSNEADFKSESREIQLALEQVGKLLRRLRPSAQLAGSWTAALMTSRYGVPFGNKRPMCYPGSSIWSVCSSIVAPATSGAQSISRLPRSNYCV